MSPTVTYHPEPSLLPSPAASRGGRSTFIVNGVASTTAMTSFCLPAAECDRMSINAGRARLSGNVSQRDSGHRAHASEATGGILGSIESVADTMVASTLPPPVPSLALPSTFECASIPTFLSRIPLGGTVDFWAWLTDEVQSRPDETQLPKVPRSHLLEVYKVPWRLEKLLGFGMFFCLDIMLYELSFMPLRVTLAIPCRFIGRCCGGRRAGRRAQLLTVTEQCDLVRLTLLILNVCLVYLVFDVSWLYHYIRGESFLKLYVFFNMLEMFERWVRSIGVDLFDLLMASVREPCATFLPKYLVTLTYCFVHTTMHLLRVLLLNMAITNTSTDIQLLIVTNNFGEIKSTVFKRYDMKGLFPIVCSDIVERFYLGIDILFVLVRLSISPHRGRSYPQLNVWYCVLWLIVLEVVTDWIKFCLITKFSDLQASVYGIYKEVLTADILVCRAARGGSEGSCGGTGNPNFGASSTIAAPPAPLPSMPFRGIHPFSQTSARRLGFSGVPMTTLVVLHAIMVLQSPCMFALQLPRDTVLFFVAAVFTIVFLAKVLLAVVMLGCAARRRKKISKGLEAFAKIKSL